MAVRLWKIHLSGRCSTVESASFPPRRNFNGNLERTSLRVEIALLSKRSGTALFLRLEAHRVRSVHYSLRLLGLVSHDLGLPFFPSPPTALCFFILVPFPSFLPSFPPAERQRVDHTPLKAGERASDPPCDDDDDVDPHPHTLVGSTAPSTEHQQEERIPCKNASPRAGPRPPTRR